MRPLVYPNHILDFYKLVYFKPFTLNKHLSLINSLTETVRNRRSNPLTLNTESDHIRALIVFMCFFNFATTSLIVFFLIISIGRSINYQIPTRIVTSLIALALAFLMIYVDKFINRKTLIITKNNLITLLFVFLAALVIPINITNVPVISIDITLSSTRVSLFLGILFGFELGVVISLIVFSSLSSINISLATSVFASVIFWVIISVTTGKGLAGNENFFGIAFFVSFVLSFVRFPFYAFEIMQMVYRYPYISDDTSITIEQLRLPILWDELILFPLPTLDKQLVAIALKNRRIGLDTISVAASSIRQTWAARNAIIQLIGEDIKLAKSLSGIANVSSTLAWLPDESRSLYKSVLLGMEEISAHARAALESNTLYNKRERLLKALELTIRIRSGFIVAAGPRLAEQWGAGLTEWQNLFEVELQTLRNKDIIPNVFVAGSPLATESKVFKGRSDLFRALENELSSAAERHPTLMLFGARRTGKTSVIKQLPVHLGPQVIPVEIDLQSVSTATNVVGLLNRISDIIKNCCITRHINLSELSKVDLEKDPYTVFENWMDYVGKTLEGRWLLLALDEYETIGDLIAQRQLDENFFKLLRSLIQHHSKIILLFSGAHTLEDLPPVWSHYLVNVSILKVNPLNEYDARELITKPIPEFNLMYRSGTVERILNATGCHPYLIQLTCRDLVNYLNDNSRSYAAVTDIEKALSSALISGTAYFHDLYYGRDSDKVQQSVLLTLARSGFMGFIDLKDKTKLSDSMLKATLKRLMRRDVLIQIEGNYHFQVELVQRWIESKI
jgi:uncharacterized protein